MGRYRNETVKEDMAEKLFSKVTDSLVNQLRMGLSRWRFNKNGRAGSDNTYRDGPANHKAGNHTLFADFIAALLKHFRTAIL